ncbi:MAG: hypothetical protein ACRD07_14670 [Acidimicrobiales bacterium]
MRSVPRILFPLREEPLRALVRRITVAVGVLVFVAEGFGHTQAGDTIVCVSRAGGVSLPFTGAGS